MNDECYEGMSSAIASHLFLIPPMTSRVVSLVATLHDPYLIIIIIIDNIIIIIIDKIIIIR